MPIINEKNPQNTNNSQSNSSGTYGSGYQYNSNIGNGQLPPNFWGAANKAYVRQPTQEEMVDSQLNRITAQNSPFIQQARNQAMAAAAGRGLGNSSYAAGNAQAAAIRSAMPMAQQNATAYSQAASENQNWLNQRDINSENNATSRANASNANQTQKSIAELQAAAALQRQREDLAYNGEQAGLGRAFNQLMADRGQGYNLQNMGIAQGYNMQNAAMNNYYNQEAWQRNLYGNTLGTTLGTVLSSPDYFGNPDAAFGMIGGFSDYVGNLLNQYLGG